MSQTSGYERIFVAYGKNPLISGLGATTSFFLLLLFL
jgi:hypothetical protein